MFEREGYHSSTAERVGVFPKPELTRRLGSLPSITVPTELGQPLMVLPMLDYLIDTMNQMSQTTLASPAVAQVEEVMRITKGAL